MPPLAALSEPLDVSAVDGEIAIVGPDGLAASLTVEAAEQSLERLRRAIEEVRGSSAGQPYQKPLG